MSVRAKRPSQCELILEVLADGRSHGFREIHAHAGFCRLNSRIAELRARGYDIPPCERVDGDYRYRLVGPLAKPGTHSSKAQSADFAREADPGSSSGAVLTANSASVLVGDGAAPLQLDLFGIAA